MKYGASLIIVGRSNSKVHHHDIEAPNPQEAARMALAYWRLALDQEPTAETTVHVYAVNEETGEREPDVLAVLSWDRPVSAHFISPEHPCEAEMAAYFEGRVSEEAIAKMEQHLGLLRGVFARSGATSPAIC